MNTQQLFQALGIIKKKAQDTGTTFVQNVKRDVSDIQNNPQAFKQRQDAFLQDPDTMAMLMGITSPVQAVKGAKAVGNIVTQLPRGNTVSNMVPTTLVDEAGQVGSKVYRSSRDAIRAASMKPLEAGKKLFIKPQFPSQLEVLTQRMMELQKRGVSTSNVEKAIAKELKVGR